MGEKWESTKIWATTVVRLDAIKLTTTMVRLDASRPSTNDFSIVQILKRAFGAVMGHLLSFLSYASLRPKERSQSISGLTFPHLMRGSVEFVVMAIFIYLFSGLLETGGLSIFTHIVWEGKWLSLRKLKNHPGWSYMSGWCSVVGTIVVMCCLDSENY